MSTYWEKIVSRFWWSRCRRTFIWGVGDIWRLWLVQRRCVSVIFWLHKSTQTCLSFIFFLQCIKWGTWASLPAGAVLWLNWLCCLNLSLGMNCGFGCCVISGHLTMLSLFLSLLIFKPQRRMGEEVWPWNCAWSEKHLVSPEGSHWHYLKMQVFTLALGSWVLFLEDDSHYMQGLEQEGISVRF